MPDIQVTKNQSRKVTSDKFKTYMVEMRGLGKLILPAERDLCRILNCSRTNLRLILDEYEECGDIVKKNRSRSLSMEKVTGRKILGCFSFVAGGDNMISNPCWNKLWMRLQPLAEAEGVVPRLCLIGNGSDAGEVLRRIADGPDVVVLANSSAPELTREIARLPGKKIIVVDEQYYIPGRNRLVTVDNFSIGHMAARELASRGYQRPAWICNDIVLDGGMYKMYEQRLKGFRAGCKEMKLEYGDSSEFFIAGNRIQTIVKIIKLMGTLKNGPFDSLFVFSDDDIEFVYQGMLEEGIRVPGDIGLITVNSFDCAIGNTPRITSVSHATHAVTARLLEVLKAIFAQQSYDIEKMYLEPSIHPGGTL